LHILRELLAADPAKLPILLPLPPEHVQGLPMLFAAGSDANRDATEIDAVREEDHLAARKRVREHCWRLRKLQTWPAVYRIALNNAARLGILGEVVDLRIPCTQNFRPILRDTLGRFAFVDLLGSGQFNERPHQSRLSWGQMATWERLPIGSYAFVPIIPALNRGL
jgi:hypothetical protein